MRGGDDLRIFKHRGDIYISAGNRKADIEQKVLLILLAFIIAFTVVFVVLLGIKYDFSAKKFFAPENLEEPEVYYSEELPQVEGKTNFLFIMSNTYTEEIYVCSIIQVDLDSTAYKVCTFDPGTVSDGRSMNDIYKTGGAGGVAGEISRMLGCDIDYYIDQNTDGYKKMFSALGNINYTVLSDIRYKDSSIYGFNIKIKEGDQSIDGDTASKLLRYYMSQKDYRTVSEILLTSLSQQINSENYEKRESLFSKFIDSAATNITVKSYTEGEDGMRVLSDETTGVNVYSVSPVYSSSSVTAESLSDIRGYFSK